MAFKDETEYVLIPNKYRTSTGFEFPAGVTLDTFRVPPEITGEMMKAVIEAYFPTENTHT